ncbi:SHOCT domain-containing protein [Kitasatospora sp. NPDC059571]|uniref:SHOCT domain-containing protein n=1 Tax=Kitasatospora sp. NPDC059571 TaxID=3346871 RepID=UPI00367C2719
MQLATDYPVLNIFWTMLMFFLWILWFFLLFKIILDIFRSDDVGGWGKAGWLIFVILLPFLGVFVYLIARGRSMGERDLKQMQDQQAAMDSYIRKTAGTGGGSTTEELARLADLKQQGAISEEEFAKAKAKLLT